MNRWYEFVDAIDHFKLFRRISFIWVLWLTTETFTWAMQYINTVPPDNAGAAAALVAAILTPISAVQGWVLKIYLENSLNQVKLTKDRENAS